MSLLVPFDLAGVVTDETVSWELLDDLADVTRALWTARARAIREGRTELAAELLELIDRFPDQRKAPRT